MEQSHYIGHRKRIKKKFLEFGLESWQEYEVLELLLSYAIPRKDTKLLAKELLLKFKTLRGILEANETQLGELKGISIGTITFIKLIKEIFKKYSKSELASKDLISSSNCVVEFLKNSLGSLQEEEVHVLFLDNGNRLIKSEKLSSGNMNKSFIFPSKIAKRALELNASGIIVAHNHPGGSNRPSKQDIETTQALSDAMKTLEINFLDHLIISDNGYFSLKDSGLL